MAKIKKGSIVIPKIGVHKGEKHTVIHDFGNGTYNIQPMGFRNKYHLGAAGAKASDLKYLPSRWWTKHVKVNCIRNNGVWQETYG